MKRKKYGFEQDPFILEIKEQMKIEDLKSKERQQLFKSYVGLNIPPCKILRISTK